MFENSSLEVVPIIDAPSLVVFQARLDGAFKQSGPVEECPSPWQGD